MALKNILKQLFKLSAQAAAALVFAAAATARGEPRLSVSASAERIYLGDAFIAQVVLLDAEGEPSAPRFENVADAEFKGGAPQASSSSRISVINGKRSVEENRSVLWQYQVTPQKAGVFAAGAVSVEVGGRTLSARLPAVEVVGEEEQSLLAVALAASRADVLLEEEFFVSVEITVRRLPGDYADVDPLQSGADSQPAHLALPFLDDGALANAALARPVADLLNPLLQRRGDSAGIRLNNFTVNDSPGMFSFFRGTSAALFYPHRSEAADAEGNPVFKYRFEFPFKGVSEGVMKFAPVRFRGAVVAQSGAGAGGEFALERIFALSNPLEVRVVPPPPEGRPASFIGSLATRVGAAAAIDAQTCREGDPLNLSLDITGDATLANMRAPDIALAKGMADLFRQYGAVESEALPGGGRRYKYKIRPIASGTIELPAIPVSYFDTRSRGYKTVHTAPVPLRVNPAPELDAGLFLGAPTNAAAFLPPAKTRHISGLLADAGPDAPPLRRAAAALQLALPPALFALAVALSGLWRARAEISNAVKKRAAPSKATRRLASAKDPASVFKALSMFFDGRAAAASGAGAALTPDDVRARLETHGGIAPETIAEIDRILREIFNASFDPSADPSQAVKKHRPRLSELFAGIRFLLAFALLGGAGAAADAAAGTDAAAAPPQFSQYSQSSQPSQFSQPPPPPPPQAQDFYIRQAMAAAAEASQPGDFATVAALYRAVIESRPRNPGLLYNYGTTLLLAGDNAAAADAFERAEALCGATPELENNLALAFGESAPWLRIPLFWHYGAPLDRRVDALFAAWALFWLGLLLRRFKLRRAGIVLAALALAATIALASSVLASVRALERPLPLPQQPSPQQQPPPQQQPQQPPQQQQQQPPQQQIGGME